MLRFMFLPLFLFGGPLDFVTLPSIESINRHVERAYVTQPHPVVREIPSGRAVFHHIRMMNWVVATQRFFIFTSKVGEIFQFD